MSVKEDTLWDKVKGMVIAPDPQKPLLQHQKKLRMQDRGLERQIARLKKTEQCHKTLAKKHFIRGDKQEAVVHAKKAGQTRAQINRLSVSTQTNHNEQVIVDEAILVNQVVDDKKILARKLRSANRKNSIARTQRMVQNHEYQVELTKRKNEMVMLDEEEVVDDLYGEDDSIDDYAENMIKMFQEEEACNLNLTLTTISHNSDKGNGHPPPNAYERKGENSKLIDGQLMSRFEKLHVQHK